MRTLLVDMSNLFYRAYYTNKKIVGKGIPCGGIFGSVMMLDSLLSHFKPQSVVCAWDKGLCFRRLKRYPQYKAGRRKGMTEEEKKNIDWQMQKLREIFECTPVRNILLEGIEADDIIGYLSKSLKDEKVIVSNDHDYIQCVDKNVKLYIPLKSKLLNIENVDDFLDFDHSKFVLWKAIVGDTSDNIKGIFKVGPVKATKIINEKQKLKQEWKEVLNRNINLMTVGSILNDKDKAIIRKQYSREKLQFSTNKIMVKLGALGLLNLFQHQLDWMSNFKRIRRS